MRLFLDGHVSSRVIAHALRKDGHDVLAADEHEHLKTAADQILLRMAAEDQRIFVTFDIKDFPDVLRVWAGQGRRHCGCIIFGGVAHDQFGLVLRLLRTQLERFPDPAYWRDLPVLLGPGSFHSE